MPARRRRLSSERLSTVRLRAPAPVSVKPFWLSVTQSTPPDASMESRLSLKPTPTVAWTAYWSPSVLPLAVVPIEVMSRSASTQFFV